MSPFKIFSTALAGIVGLLALSAVFGSWYTVDQGERVVVLTYGEITGVEDPGLHWKLPFIQSVVSMDVRTNVKRYDSVAAYSNDQQVAVLQISVNYRIDENVVADIYDNYGSKEQAVAKILDPKLHEQSKNVFGRYTAVRAIQERGQLNFDVSKAIFDAVQLKGLIIESVQIENIDFDDSYEAAIADAAAAKAEVEKAKSQLLRVEQEQQQKVKQAEAEAAATRLVADANAYAVRINGEAEAAAIELRGKALRLNPELVQLITAEKWDGKLPTTQVPGSAVPFVNVK